jgi:hypothetical protein
MGWCTEATTKGGEKKWKMYDTPNALLHHQLFGLGEGGLEAVALKDGGGPR